MDSGQVLFQQERTSPPPLYNLKLLQNQGQMQKIKINQHFEFFHSL